MCAGMDTAERVEAMFDSISYDKGGSVLRMLRAYLNRVSDPKPLLRRSLAQASLLQLSLRLCVRLLELSWDGSC